MKITKYNNNTELQDIVIKNLTIKEYYYFISN